MEGRGVCLLRKGSTFGGKGSAFRVMGCLPLEGEGVPLEGDWSMMIDQTLILYTSIESISLLAMIAFLIVQSCL